METNAADKAEVPAPPKDVRLFAPEVSAEGCASGECLPEVEVAPAPVVLATPVVVPPLAPTTPVSKDDPGRTLTERWRAAVETLKSESARHGSSMSHAFVLWMRPGQVSVAFKPEAGFHKTQATTQSGRATIEKSLANHFGIPTRLVVDEQASITGPTLAEMDLREREARELSTDTSVRGHPAVRAALRILGGELEHVLHLEPAPTGPPSTDDDVPTEESA